MIPRRIVVTGASGFIGRHLLEAFGDESQIFALGRSAPGSRGLALPPGVRWLTADVASREDLDRAMVTVREAGGVEVFVHLAGHYDFTGERHPEYQRTNVQGTRNALAAARALGVRDFVFASSVAACGFPSAGEALSEHSPPDGDTPYAESKRAGERMLEEYRGSFRAWVVRFAALFSDWCEYEPLFRFMETWLSHVPRGRILAGHGLSAVPYLHVRDAIAFLRALLECRDRIDPAIVLLASSDGATSHREIFEAATLAQFGTHLRPILVPRPLCRAGLWTVDAVGRGLGAPRTPGVRDRGGARRLPARARPLPALPDADDPGARPAAGDERAADRRFGRSRPQRRAEPVPQRLPHARGTPAGGEGSRRRADRLARRAGRPLRAVPAGA